jgi:probable rRNA maturation factor
VTSRYLAPWRIDVEIRPTVPRPLPVRISRLVRAIAVALDVAGAPSPAAIGLILSDDAELAELNERHLGHEGATDVLSFPLLSAESYPSHAGGPLPDADMPARPAAPPFAPPPGRRLHLGDIVVSVERAIDQAHAGRGGQTGDIHWSPADELRLLVTHGALHVCGWDHAEPGEEREMRSLEQRLLADG